MLDHSASIARPRIGEAAGMPAVDILVNNAGLALGVASAIEPLGAELGRAEANLIDRAKRPERI